VVAGRRQATAPTMGAALGCACAQICSPAADTVKRLGTAVTGGATGATAGALLDEFTVGKVLGRGSFGVVSNCTRRFDREELAVKLVDLNTVPKSRIRKEAVILSEIAHDNVVGYHGSYHHGRDGRFFCLVMDHYKGGDLIDGLERRGSAVGCNEAAHICRQVAHGIQHLHQIGILHRDVKGENVLIDKWCLADPMARCALTDFGAATRWTKGQRLEERTGTRLFWSPEFYDRNYADKVDVWALGCVAYCLVTFKLPFADERDVWMKQVDLGDAVDQSCADLVGWMLQKKEELRPSMDEVVTHSWLAVGGMSRCCSVGSVEDEVLADPEEEVPLLEPPRLEHLRAQRQQPAHEAAGKEDAPFSFSAPTSLGRSSVGRRELEASTSEDSSECPEMECNGKDPLGSFIGWTMQRVGAH